MRDMMFIAARKLLAAVRRGDPDVRVVVDGKTYAMHVCGLDECDKRRWRLVTSGTKGGQFRFYCCEQHRLIQQRRLTNARQKRWKRHRQRPVSPPEKAPELRIPVTHLYR